MAVHFSSFNYCISIIFTSLVSVLFLMYAFFNNVVITSLTFIFIVYRPNERREDVAELLHQSLTADDYTYGSIGSGTDEYELVGNSFSQNPILPPRSPVIRGRPLSPAQWSEFIEIDPALRDVDSVRSVIFSGVISFY